MSSELLAATVLKTLRVRAGRLRPELNRLASELCGVLEWLGYETTEPRISAGTAYARLRILFKSPGEVFGLLLHAARPGMIYRHVTGYARQNPSAPPSDRDLLDRVLQMLACNEESLPVLEITWRVSWPRLVGVMPYRPCSDELVGVVFDRAVGRTSSSSQRSICRVAILARGVTWIHLLALIRGVVPRSGPRRLKYNEVKLATIDEP